MQKLYVAGNCIINAENLSGVYVEKSKNLKDRYCIIAHFKDKTPARVLYDDLSQNEVNIKLDLLWNRL